ARSQSDSAGGSRLEILPGTVDLRGPHAEHGLLVTRVAADGTRTDVTHACRFSSSDAQVVTVSPEGHCRALADGKAEVVAELDGLSARLFLTVADTGKATPPSFRQDVVAV